MDDFPNSTAVGLTTSLQIFARYRPSGPCPLSARRKKKKTITSSWLSNTGTTRREWPVRDKYLNSLSAEVDRLDNN